MLFVRPPIDRPLRRPEQTRAMRDFLYVGGFAMPYGTIVGVAGPIFAGFMLHMGIEKAAIGLILSFAQITGLVQMASFRLTDLVHPRKLLVGAGTLEILFTVSVITVPLWVPEGWTFTAIVALVMLGWISAQVHVPTFNSWFASVIPPELRGRYISKRTFIQYSVGIAATLLAGRFIDAVPGYTGFATLYMVALAFGLVTYWTLWRTPLPRLSSNDDADSSAGAVSHWDRLFAPLKNRDYRLFITFNVVWILVIAMPGPYYNVFMIDGLSLSYSTIAVFTSAQMVVMGLGFRFWGIIVDRFGGKPMIELLFIPTILMPLLWAFARPDAYWTVPIAMLLGGLGFSGLSIANSIMLYAIIPQDARRSSYFAVWSVSIGLASAIAPAVGSAVIGILGDLEVEVLGWTFDRFHMLFALVSVLGALPALLVMRLPSLGAGAPRHMIHQLTRGNPFSFAYNFFLLNRTNRPTRRAGLLRSLGRSRSPLALEKLISSLEHYDREIRRSAALALGDSRRPEVYEVLVSHLRDEDSDIRVECTQALGALGSENAIPVLTEMLEDPDAEVREAAATALGAMRTVESRNALLEQLTKRFDRVLTPAICEALSYPLGGERIGDLRMLPSAVEAISRLKSRAVRLQVLTAIARCLGVGDEYSELIQDNPYDRDEKLQETVTRMRKHLPDLPWPESAVLQVVSSFEHMALAQSENRQDDFVDRALEQARFAFSFVEPEDVPDEIAIVRGAFRALVGLCDSGLIEPLGPFGTIFIVVVLEKMIAQARLNVTA